MKIRSHKVFPEVKIIELEEHEDERGSFCELVNLGIMNKIAQVNLSKNKHNVFRGLHAQYNQSKLVMCIKGCINDYIVNPDTKQHIKIGLMEKDNTAIFIPAGWLHGFHATGIGDNHVLYAVSELWNKDDEVCFNYKGILSLPKDIILSEKDKKALTLK